MSTLAEIEAAADALPPEEKQELLLYLAVRLRSGGSVIPPPRSFARLQIDGWVADDEADLRRFREAK